MEFFFVIAGICLIVWYFNDGPEKLMAHREAVAEANARAEEARLQRALIERK